MGASAAASASAPVVQFVVLREPVERLVSVLNMYIRKHALCTAARSDVRELTIGELERGMSAHAALLAGSANASAWSTWRHEFGHLSKGMYDDILARFRERNNTLRIFFFDEVVHLAPTFVDWLANVLADASAESQTASQVATCLRERASNARRNSDPGRCTELSTADVPESVVEFLHKHNDFFYNRRRI